MRYKFVSAGYGASPGYPTQMGYPPPPGGGYPGGFGGPPPGADHTLWNWFVTVDRDRSGQITADELQQALINGNWSHFNSETCRLMIGDLLYYFSCLIKLECVQWFSYYWTILAILIRYNSVWSVTYCLSLVKINHSTPPPSSPPHPPSHPTLPLLFRCLT